MSEQNVQVTQALADDGYTEHAKEVLARAERRMERLLPAKDETSRQCERRCLIEAIAEALAEQSLRHRTGAEPDLVEVLKDPNAVHVNMLRGSIARPSVRQIIHIYGEEALRAEMTSQQPDLVEVLRKCADKLEQERDELLHSVCVVRDGMPDRSTISAEDAEFVAPFDDLIEEARAALSRADGETA